MAVSPVIELELYLARHGQSMSNVGLIDPRDERRLQDPPLTDKGLRQVALLGEFYARVQFDCILSSGLTRALQTAAAVAERQPGGARPIEAHPVFSECGIPTAFGVKSFAEIAAAFPTAVPAAGLQGQDSFVLTQDAPTDDELLARAQDAIAYLRARFTHGEKVFLAAHAMFNTFLQFAALGLGVTEIFDLANDNSCVTKFIFFKQGTGPWERDVHLMYHNDHSHLAAAFPEDVVRP